jgi:divalent metal cation (Fe/Co/Zn/Cd) transporter
VADPPAPARDPRRRAAARLAAAVLALALAVVGVVAALAAGFSLNADWPVVAGAGALGAGILAVAALGLRRAGLERPVHGSERTALLRAAAICLALAAAALTAAYVLPAVDAVVGIGFGLLAALEGVALARPGGAGLRRVPTPQETGAVEAAIIHGPPEVAGHRRLVVRSTGGAQYLSVEVLLRRPVAPGRAQAIRDHLQHAIKQALPELVVDVRPVLDPDAAVAAAPDPTRSYEDATERLDPATPPPSAAGGDDGPGPGEVLGSAPWRQDPTPTRRSPS